MRSVKIVLCLLSALMVCAPARAQRRRKSTRPPASRPTGPVYVANSLDSPTDGEVKGQTYTNKYFGMKLTFPEGWFVLNDVGKEEAKERAKTMVAPKSALEKQMIEQSLERTFHLLYVKQYLDATPERPSANLIVVGELLPVMNMTPVQYAEVTKNIMLTRGVLKVEAIGDITTETLAGEEFALLRVKMELADGLQVKQEYHVTIRRGWALGFISSYVDEQQHALLSESLKSLTFEKPSK